MDYLYLFLITAGMAAQNVLRKHYTDKTDKISGSAQLFNFTLTLSAALLLGAVSCFGFTWSSGTLIYALAWGAGYASAVIFIYLSVKNGSLALPSLMVQFSLMLPTLYGVIFLGEKLSIPGIIGLFLLILSMIGINIPQKGEKTSPKCFIFAFLAFLGNGLGGIMQKLHQIRYPGEFRIEFLLIGVTAVTIVNGILLIIKHPPREQTKKTLKSYGSLPVVTGLINALSNILIMVLASSLPASLMFPVISAGGIVLTFIVSVTVYRERFSAVGYIAYFLGTCSVVLLNL